MSKLDVLHKIFRNHRWRDLDLVELLQGVEHRLIGVLKPYSQWGHRSDRTAEHLLTTVPWNPIFLAFRILSDSGQLPMTALQKDQSATSDTIIRSHGVQAPSSPVSNPKHLIPIRKRIKQQPMLRLQLLPRLDNLWPLAPLPQRERDGRRASRAVATRALAPARFVACVLLRIALGWLPSGAVPAAWMCLSLDYAGWIRRGRDEPCKVWPEARPGEG